MLFTYILVFLVSLLVTYFITPGIIALAVSLNVVDKPGGRRVNIRTVPRWGGIAVFLGILLSLFLAFIFSPAVKEMFFSAVRLKGYFYGLIFGCCVIVYIGVRDDKIGITATEKLFGQIIAAQMIVLYGVKIVGFSFPFLGRVDFSFIVSIVFTVFWIVAFINAVNFIDGLDGLATGIVAITLIAFGVIAFRQTAMGVIAGETVLNQRFVLLIIFSVLGACLAFLKYNFNPARIFLGDSGSMLLGYIIAVLTIIGILKSVATMTIIIPIIVLGIPFIDTVAAVVRRWRRNLPISSPDRKHFHHRLLATGLSHRNAVLVAYAFTVILAVISVIYSFKNGN